MYSSRRVPVQHGTVSAAIEPLSLGCWVSGCDRLQFGSVQRGFTSQDSLKTSGMPPKTKRGKATKRGTAEEQANEAAATAAPRKATRRGGRHDQAPDLEADNLSSLLAAEQDRAEPLARHGRARERLQALTAGPHTAPRRRTTQAADMADPLLWDPEDVTPQADKYGDFAMDEQVSLLNLLGLSMCCCKLM